MEMVVEDVMEAEEERPVHQGCMAGFLHLFDLSGRRLHHTPRRLVSFSSTGSAERPFLRLDRPAPSSPPAAPRPSLQLPPLDVKGNGGDLAAAPSWRLPRLSLDSCAVVDGTGKYRPREIRTPPSPSVVVARLMGLDALPRGDGGRAAAELRRSASERVPRGDNPARFRFVDPASFERPPSPPPEHRPTSLAATRCAPDAGGGMVQQRFDAREVFPPDPARGGEVALYGEIERRLRRRGVAEPVRDLDTLKQVLEALQLKGMLRHTPITPPPPRIVLMRPASQQHPTHARRQQCGAHSPQWRASSPAARSSKQQFGRSSTFDAAGAARSRIAQRAAQNSRVALFPDEEAASSRWEFEPVLDDETNRKLERCGKLLSSIQAFTGGGDADQQPSPVSVLHAASFLADEDSPSSSAGSKRAIDFDIARSPRKAAVVSDPAEDDESWRPTVTVNPDYSYVAELVRLFHGGKWRDPAYVYEIAEQRRRRLHPADADDQCHHRRLLCGAVAEALERQRSACPWDPASWLRGGELLDHVWAEVRRAREPVSAEGLNDVTCSAAVRCDLRRHPRRPGPEVADAVLHIERLVFKDLVVDTIRELADADRLLMPRRRLVF